MMRRAASKTMNWNEEHYAQSDIPLVPGLIIVLDIDNFEEYVNTRGLDPYKPNIVTSELTRLIENFVWKYKGVVVYGLSYERGTEEAIIEIPFGYENLENTIIDLEKIKKIIEEFGVTLSIVIVVDYVIARKAKNRRDAYKGTPGRIRALKALRRIKRRDGGKILLLT